MTNLGISLGLVQNGNSGGAATSFISVVSPPVLGPLAHGATPQSAFTSGSYTARSGSITGQLAEASVNGQAYAAAAMTAPVSALDTVTVRETVTDDKGRSRSFLTQQRTVPAIAPQVSVAIDQAPQAGNVLGTDITATVTIDQPGSPALLPGQVSGSWKVNGIPVADGTALTYGDSVVRVVTWSHPSGNGTASSTARAVPAASAPQVSVAIDQAPQAGNVLGTDITATVTIDQPGSPALLQGHVSGSWKVNGTTVADGIALTYGDSVVRVVTWSHPSGNGTASSTARAVPAASAPQVSVAIDQAPQAGNVLGTDITATVTIDQPGSPALLQGQISGSWKVNGTTVADGIALTYGDSVVRVVTWSHPSGNGTASSTARAVPAASAPQVSVAIDQAPQAGNVLGTDITATVTIDQPGSPALLQGQISGSWKVNGTTVADGTALTYGDSVVRVVTWSHPSGNGTASSTARAVPAASAPVVSVAIDQAPQYGNLLGTDVTATVTIVQPGTPALLPGQVSTSWRVNGTAAANGAALTFNDSVVRVATWSHPSGAGTASSAARTVPAASAPQVTVALAASSYAAGVSIGTADILPTIVSAGYPALTLASLTRGLKVNGTAVTLPYTAAAGATLVPQASASHPTGAISVSGSTVTVSGGTPFSFSSTTDGQIEAAGGTGNLTLTITAPAVYAGTYTTDQSAEYTGTLNIEYINGTAPQCAKKPSIARTTDADGSGTSTIGDTYTATPGLWLYDTAAALAVTGQWYLNGAPISGATGPTCTPATVGTLTYRETTSQAGKAVRTAASGSVSVTSQTAFAPVHKGSYLLASGDGVSGLYTIPGVPSGTGKMVIAMSARPGGTTTSTLTIKKDGVTTAYLSDGTDTAGSAANFLAWIRVHGIDVTDAPGSTCTITVNHAGGNLAEGMVVDVFMLPAGALVQDIFRVNPGPTNAWQANQNVEMGPNAGGCVLAWTMTSAIYGPTLPNIASGFDIVTGVTAVNWARFVNPSSSAYYIVGSASNVPAGTRVISLGDSDAQPDRVAAVSIAFQPGA